MKDLDKSQPGMVGAVLIAGAVDQVLANYQTRFVAEVLRPLLAELEALEAEMKNDFLRELPSDPSIESVEWFARNLKKVLRVRSFLQNHEL